MAVLEAVEPLEVGEMKSLASRFLNENEQRAVTEAVMQTEKSTTGEVVPMIVSMSHDYPRAKLTASLLASVVITLALTYGLSSLFWVAHDNLYFNLVFFLPIFLFCYILSGKFPSIYRPFISHEEMVEEVEEEAITSFFRENLHDTKERNGTLLFISVYEKRAWILADHGVQQKVDNLVWLGIVEKLTSQISGRNRCDAICTAVLEIGTILKEHFPDSKNDRDELHNLIIR